MKLRWEPTQSRSYSTSCCLLDGSSRMFIIYFTSSFVSGSPTNLSILDT